MIRRSLSLAALALVAAVGCQPKMTMEDMKAHRPQRPAELDALNAFVGTWQGTGTCTMLMVDGKPEIATSGTSTTQWEADGWYLVERSTYEMGELGTMQGIGIWTYDAKDKEYEMDWYDTMGGTGEGEAKRNPDTGVWTMKSQSDSAHGKSYGEGTVKFIDDNTMEWTWKEWGDALHMMPIMEMKGTSTRSAG